MFAFLNRPLSQQSSPSVRGGWRMRATRVTQAAERPRSRSPKRGHKRCKATERHLKDCAIDETFCMDELLADWFPKGQQLFTIMRGCAKTPARRTCEQMSTSNLKVPFFSTF